MTHRWLDKLKDEPLMQDESSKKHAFRDIQWLNFALRLCNKPHPLVSGKFIDMTYFTAAN